VLKVCCPPATLAFSADELEGTVSRGVGAIVGCFGPAFLAVGNALLGTTVAEEVVLVGPVVDNEGDGCGGPDGTKVG